jgi:hypothetical protein
LAVDVLALQPALFTFSAHDAIAVAAPETTQYLFVHVEVESGTAPPREDLRFELGEESVAPSDRQKDLWYVHNPGDERYEADTGRGWVLFELPDSPTGDTTKLRWTGGEWMPPAAIARRLVEPTPTLSVEVSIPEEVIRQSDPELVFTVTNDGPVGSRFVCGVNRHGGETGSDVVASFTELLPAGESKTLQVVDQSDVRVPDLDDIDDGEPDMEYSVRWESGGTSRDVRIVSGYASSPRICRVSR